MQIKNPNFLRFGFYITESYEQLLNDYENYINELEEKSDLSEGDKTALTNTKAEYEKLKKLQNE